MYVVNWLPLGCKLAAQVFASMQKLNFAFFSEKLQKNKRKT